MAKRIQTQVKIKAIERFAQGWSETQVAAECGVSTGTAHAWAVEARTPRVTAVAHYDTLAKGSPIVDGVTVLRRAMRTPAGLVSAVLDCASVDDDDEERGARASLDAAAALLTAALDLIRSGKEPVGR